MIPALDVHGSMPDSRIGFFRIVGGCRIAACRSSFAHPLSRLTWIHPDSDVYVRVSKICSETGANFRPNCRVFVMVAVRFLSRTSRLTAAFRVIRSEGYFGMLQRGPTREFLRERSRSVRGAVGHG